MPVINTQWIKYYSDTIIWIVNSVLVPVLIALAFFVFLVGAYRFFILGATTGAAKKEGRDLMIYGVIGFVIIFSIWGIINILISTLGLGGGTVPPYPTISPGTGSTVQTSPFQSGATAPSGTSGFATGGSDSAAIQAVNSALATYNQCVVSKGATQCQSQLQTYQQAYRAAFPSSTSGNVCSLNADSDGAACGTHGTCRNQVCVELDL
jgi:hypothetical protein